MVVASGVSRWSRSECGPHHWSGHRHVKTAQQSPVALQESLLLLPGGGLGLEAAHHALYIWIFLPHSCYYELFPVKEFPRYFLYFNEL